MEVTVDIVDDFKAVLSSILNSMKRLEVNQQAIAKTEHDITELFDEIKAKVSSSSDKAGAIESKVETLDDVSSNKKPATLTNTTSLAPTAPGSSSVSSSLSSIALASAGVNSVTTIDSITTKPLYPSRVILTTYPAQVGIKPIKVEWGSPDPLIRGPVVASRHPSSLRIRNAIGAFGGSYCIYRALSVAMGALDPNHRPNFENTEPAIEIGPHPQWSDPTKICSLDPWGAVTPNVFSHLYDQGLDIRPTIAITKAHMTLPDLEMAIKNGRLQIDGKIVLTQHGEVNVVKAAVEPVWYLPEVAKRFNVDESLLRRALFEDTGGMYPELITRPDLQLFLPPIGGLTVYIFGNPQYVSDPTKELTLRVHDECNGSDVFGSDICTCRPYLIYGIEEALKCAQRGGSGVIVYFRKEGRALGEVTKYLVYNARKKVGDTADKYFERTEQIAGVRDARYQSIMPDVLHWLGITKIDRMMSMSNMKYDAIVQSGIIIKERVPIPDDLIPADSRVEIDAKIASGYFTTSKVPTTEDLAAVKGRDWDDIHH